jgi:proline iminopeptidase
LDDYGVPGCWDDAVMDQCDAGIEPSDRGMLDVGDGNSVYWEVWGNPAGKPALVVHGGPGSGSSPGMRRYFDPARYRVVQFDQRGCGRSTPHAGVASTDMTVNTTAHLLRDMELLREHLGIDSWLLHGGSWGSTLILAYAEQCPDRVSEIVISSVTTSRRAEIDWLYEGVGRFFPEAWQQFVHGAAAGGGDVLAAYALLTDDPRASVRDSATADWCAWEDTVLSLETKGATAPYGGRPPVAQLALVRICAHYFAHGTWLRDGQILQEAGRLAGIPGVLIHGRHDLGSPLDTAWTLHRAWPTSELIVVEDAGHLGSATTRKHVLDALDRFSARPD